MRRNLNQFDKFADGEDGIEMSAPKDNSTNNTLDNNLDDTLNASLNSPKDNKYKMTYSEGRTLYFKRKSIALMMSCFVVLGIITFILIRLFVTQELVDSVKAWFAEHF